MIVDNDAMALEPAMERPSIRVKCDELIRDGEGPRPECDPDADLAVVLDGLRSQDWEICPDHLRAYDRFRIRRRVSPPGVTSAGRDVA